ncbi:mitochondrial ribosomal small subunit component [Yamadazyma tenuis]|uniref:Mitochondrial ribosomal protein L51 n=1 Tax=Candida tenuis (strain ATCC 10573 / BCRC 21748 / CBS 615 / JCM 9827 / NBRC 10315 / NRRL Y-1498 / VKM Y-70) TaxID=590646 RepID=G3B2J5_CANTC|nr:mitochondrial ribosomal protein L51 [Yamadazyma tenuis ATCC 10573]EGV64693.1 mitochondrial ribosomal protein L51 [Yamadazyma tenuis ATCC 10573]WEJ97478.1 mitochondrial ribosomal small subunit component [Yamadazyma tenuis]
MNNQELFRLFKDSKLAQVAKPLSKVLRGNQSGPTHQIIYTPKSSAIRSNFGIKTALPKQIGFSHIVYNDIDNATSMPDVEKYSGSFYNRIKFQEMNIPVRTEHNTNPLFKSEQTLTPKKAKDVNSSNEDSVSFGLNLKSSTPNKAVKKLLKKNSQFYNQYKEFMLKNYPDKLVSNGARNEHKLVHEFLNTSQDFKKAKSGLLSQKSNRIQGTGGFSYLQKGRLTNTPNGIKYAAMAPGRIIDSRDAAIGGFIASINDNNSLQRNYTKNFPGKHQRQFVIPFQVTDAEVSNSGKVRLEANGVQSGPWSSGLGENSSLYKPTNNNVRGASERMATDMKQFSALLSVLEQPAKA